MWDALGEICSREGRSVHDICAQVDRDRSQSGLTASVRVFVLNYFRDAATEEGHVRAFQRRNNHDSVGGRDSQSDLAG